MESTLRVLTSGPSHFFGFHDLTPWNPHTDELVCLRTNASEDHVPTDQDEAEVVVIDETDGREVVVGRTRAWNWQKGARQRWLPALGRRVIAYNAAHATGFECRIADLDSGTERTLPHALYDICDHAGFGLTLNFHRLVHCQPGYGYDHSTLNPPQANQHSTPNYSSDGILRVDLATGESLLILSLADFLRTQNLDPALGEHYFTHLQISPDGLRFAFMHRCLLRSGMVNNFVIANADGSDARVLLDDKVSHFDWADIDQIFIWCRKNSAIKKLKESKLLAVARTLYRLSRKIRMNAVRQGLYNESFRLLNVATGESVAVGKGILSEDGHPQVNPRHPGLWISDTYPNSEHVQTLMLYHQPTNRRLDLLRLPTQPSIQETCWRCDFHPRWHPAGQRVCVDSAHLGRRQLCIMDVAEQIRPLLNAG
jgi:hypothetical protein